MKNWNSIFYFLSYILFLVYSYGAAPLSLIMDVTMNLAIETGTGVRMLRCVYRSGRLERGSLGDGEAWGT
jgi:hypothetical protein